MIGRSRRRRGSGFTLVELLIVVAIIMIVASIGIPYMMTARRSAYEASAATFLRRIQVRQVSQHSATTRYVDNFSDLKLDDVGNVGMGSCKGASGEGKAKCSTLVYNGYIFTLSARNDDKTTEWKCLAEPISDRTNARYFFIDQTGVIRYAEGATAGKSSTPLR